MALPISGVENAGGGPGLPLPSNSSALGAQLMTTSQSSKDPLGGGNRWENYFGPSSHEIKTNAYDKYSYETYDLPEAYKGKNLFLRDTIDGFIMGDNEWYTREILPYAQTDQIHLAWNEWHFNQTLAGRVPHEGISRLITSSKRAFKDHTVRRGLAFILEHGFMNTAEGREQYRRNLLGIKQCVQETNNHDVISALINARNYDREWERKHGLYNRPLKQIMRREVNEWAIIQKDIPGMEILHEEYKKRLARYGVVPNLWIFPPKMSIYASMVPPTVVDRNHEMGVSTTKSFDQGPSSMGTFRGIKVFETRTFDVYENELPIDLLRRNQQIGEYYVMSDPHRYDDQENHLASHRDIIIYDEELDNWRRITFREAALNAINLGHDELRDKERRNARGGIPYPGGELDTKALEERIRRIRGAPPNPTGLYSMANPAGGGARLPDWDAMRVESHFGVSHKTRTVSSFCTDKNHYEEATRGWNKRAGMRSAPAFLAQRIDAHNERVIASARAHASAVGNSNSSGSSTIGTNALLPIATHFIVNVSQGAAAKNNGFVRDSKSNLLGCYASAHGAGGKHTGVAATGDTEVLFVTGRTNQKHWKLADVNINEDFALAKTQQTTHQLPSSFAAVASASASSTATPSSLPPLVRPKSLVEHCADFVNEVDAARLGRSINGASRRHVGQDMNVNDAAQWNTVQPKKRARIQQQQDGYDAASAHLFGSRGSSVQEQENEQHVNSPEYRYAQHVVNEASRLGMRFGQHGEGGLTRKADVTYAGGPRDFAFGRTISENMIKACLRAKARVPFDVLLLRPFMEYEMSSGVMMKGGYETGATFVGHSDFILGDDVVSKLHYGNFTFYSKALVTNPKNVIIAQNIFCQGYVRGNGTRFFKKTERDGRNTDDTVAIIDGYDPQYGRHEASLISVIIPYGSGDRLPNPLQMLAHGSYNPADKDKNPTAGGLHPAHFMDADMLTRIFQLDEHVASNDESAMPFRAHARTQNTICYRGHQFSYDPNTGHHTQVTINTGHWGPAVYPGCGRVRAGEMKYLDKVNYASSAVVRQN